MTRINRDALARAIKRCDEMSLTQQEDLADEIFKFQPNLFGSVLSLRKLGVPAERMNYPVQMLLVCYQAMKESGIVWPKITEEDLSRQLNRWMSSVKMGDKLNPKLRKYSTQVYIDAHPEKYLLAYVTTSLSKWLTEQPSLDSDRYVMMAVQTMVNCIAFVDLPEVNKAPP